MFDVVRGRSLVVSRLRPALVLALLAHAAMLAAAVLLPHPAAPKAEPSTVPWSRVRATQRGGGAETAGARPPSAPAQARRSSRVRPPKATEAARPAVPSPARAMAPEGTPGTDGPGGPANGGRDGEGPECATPPCGGDGPGVFSEDVVAAMPALLSGPEVTLPPEVRRTGVEGTLVVRCVITATGTVEECEVLQGVPLVEAAVLAALQARHYRPAQVEGRPVSVHHSFRVHIGRAR